MKVIYSQDRTAMQIVGDYSPHPIYAESTVVENLGGAELAYHKIKLLASRFMLPRMGSQTHPLTSRDLRYANENVQRNERYWQWYSLEGYPVKQDTGWDFVFGYGHKNAEGAIILVNANDEPVYVVNQPKGELTA